MGIIKSFIKGLPVIHGFIEDRDKLRAELDDLKKKNDLFVPPGHFYSPIPSLTEVRQNEEKIFGSIPRSIPGIDLNESDQLALFEEFKEYYGEMPFKPQKTGSLRYYFENPAFSYSDAIVLHCMIRHVKPKKIIEVGSGYSSCMMLDTNELFFQNTINTTFIEPYPKLLLSLIKKEDRDRITLIPEKLQDMDLKEFESLESNDILFIDSTHVGRVNSDVNYIFSDILPVLNKGVYIHFHDIFYPFEYPKSWVYENRAWNELYMLRTFLQFNSSFKIIFFNTFLEHFYEDKFKSDMPLCMKNKGGNIWIRKC